MKTLNAEIPVTVEPDRVKAITQRLKELLPSVTKHFMDKGRIEEWLSFFRQVDEGDLEIDHIASQLFWDVVKFNDAKTVRNMRFTCEVKEFWAVGLSLFHGKFIRFMGGLKTQDTIHEATGSKEMIPDVSKVNFICPDIKVLTEEKKSHQIGCENPGIIISNIESVANIAGAKDKCYKICLDGKKITAGFGKKLGKVDLFGHESSPTLMEKQERLNVERIVGESTQCLIEKWLKMDKDQLSCL